MPVALLLAILVIRSAFVQAFAVKDPARAAAIWPGHPSVQLESGLAEVGDMAAAGRPIDPALVRRLIVASAKAPLAPEPFLVRGVEAQLAGDQPLALKAFLAARQRNPRGIAARYFLADHYLKAGQTAFGLAEISALARLVPQSLPNVAPFLAAYARSPNAAPQVKAMLRGQPQLEPVLLNVLATDAANHQLMRYLWSGRGGEEAKPWQGRLLNSLVEAGRYGEAREAWATFSGIAADQNRLLDPEFRAQALPPFGWLLASGPAGVAEPEGAGRLHVLFYGRDDLVLARQLLTLAPGRYRLSMQVSETSPTSKFLSWGVRCLPGSTQIASVRLDRSGATFVSFAIPASGCPAQRLELIGTAPEFAEQADATISQLQLQKEAEQ